MKPLTESQEAIKKLVKDVHYEISQTGIANITGYHKSDVSKDVKMLKTRGELRLPLPKKPRINKCIARLEEKARQLIKGLIMEGTNDVRPVAHVDGGHVYVIKPVKRLSPIIKDGHVYVKTDTLQFKQLLVEYPEHDVWACDIFEIE